VVPGDLTTTESLTFKLYCKCKYYTVVVVLWFEAESVSKSRSAVISGARNLCWGPENRGAQFETPKASRGNEEVTVLVHF